MGDQQSRFSAQTENDQETKFDTARSVEKVFAQRILMGDLNDQ
jgi:hypothetical protein